jgi:hypothetical protein
MRERLPMAPLLRFMNRVRHVPREQLREGYTGCERDNRRGGVTPMFLGKCFRHVSTRLFEHHSWPHGSPWTQAESLARGQRPMHKGLVLAAIRGMGFIERRITGV